MPHTLVHADNHMFFYTIYSSIQYYTWNQLIPTQVTLLIVFVCFCQTEVCLFEVWDIPWQGTSSLLSQKCQPKGQSLFSHLSFHHHLKQMFENSLDFFFFCKRDLHEKQSWLYWPSFLSLNGGVNNDAKHVLDLYSVELEQEETNEAAEAPSRQPEEVQLWCHEWMKRKNAIVINCSFFKSVLLDWTWGRYKTCVYSVCFIWQESVELLGKFKEFMMKYNKVYSSQEGQWMQKIAACKSSAVYNCLSIKI